MSHRRKHVTAGLLDEQLEPQAGQKIVRAVGARGGNVVEVETAEGRRTLVLLPSRFNKKLWVKRGGFILIEECPEAEADGGSKITGTIVNVYYDAQIKQLKKIPGAWPTEFETKAASQDGEGVILACTLDVADVGSSPGVAKGDDQAVSTLGVDEATAALDRTAISCCTTAGGSVGTSAAPGQHGERSSSAAGGSVQNAAGSVEAAVIATAAAGGCSAAPGVSHTDRVADGHDDSCSDSDDDLPPLYQNNNRRIIYHEVDSDSEDEQDGG